MFIVFGAVSFYRRFYDIVAAGKVLGVGSCWKMHYMQNVMLLTQLTDD